MDDGKDRRASWRWVEIANATDCHSGAPHTMQAEDEQVSTMILFAGVCVNGSTRPAAALWLPYRESRAYFSWHAKV